MCTRAPLPCPWHNNLLVQLCSNHSSSMKVVGSKELSSVHSCQGGRVAGTATLHMRCFMVAQPGSLHTVQRQTLRALGEGVVLWGSWDVRILAQSSS